MEVTRVPPARPSRTTGWEPLQHYLVLMNFYLG